MSKQVTLRAERRTELGKGPTGRLRRSGRVPAIVYGHETEPTAVHVDALELYHALHTEARRNVLIRLDLDGDTTLVFARDLQIHPIRQEVTHVDFLAVDRSAPITVDVPVHLVNDDATANDGGILNQVLYTVPVSVRPLEVPTAVELDITGVAIGDVKRVEDLGGLPGGATIEVDGDTPVLTVNAPISEAALEALEESAGIEQDAPAEEVAAEADEAPAETAGDDAEA